MARSILKYRTYSFVDKSPVIDMARTILQKEGMYAKNKRHLLHQLSGVSVSTYDGWFEGDTRSPRHETIAATMTALGYEETFTKTHDIDIEAELELAAKWLAKQQAQKEKEGGGKKSKRKPNGSKKS